MCHHPSTLLKENHESSFFSYLRAEARTRLLGFVDDVEFQTRQDSSVVDMRSGSRVGYSDLGKSRRRLEALRKSLVKAELVSR